MPLETTGRWKLKEFCLGRFRLVLVGLAGQGAFGSGWGFFSPPRHVRVPAQTTPKTRGQVHVFLLSKPRKRCVRPRAFSSSGNTSGGVSGTVVGASQKSNRSRRIKSDGQWHIDLSNNYFRQLIQQQMI